MMHTKLKSFHDLLLSTVDNLSTERLSDEILNVIQDVKQIDTVNRKFKWSKADENRLNKLNTDCKLLPIRTKWY